MLTIKKITIDFLVDLKFEIILTAKRLEEMNNNNISALSPAYLKYSNKYLELKQLELDIENSIKNGSVELL